MARMTKKIIRIPIDFCQKDEIFNQLLLTRDIYAIGLLISWRQFFFSLLCLLCSCDFVGPVM